MYTPIIMIEERTIHGKVKQSILITMPNGELYSIADFDEIPDDSTMDAIRYAFIRGVEAHNMAMMFVRISAPYYKQEK